MKKIVAAADLGGAPFTKADLREVFNSEVWAVIEALLAPYNSDTQGLIISGCVISANGGGFDMTAGIVYLNGEFMRIAAVTAQSFTKYIAPSTPTSDSRSFGDGTTHAVVETKLSGLVGSAPGAGQYVTISSLTSAESRRWSKFAMSGASLILKVVSIDIGDWNMDSTTSLFVNHNLVSTKIKGILSVSIRDDDDNDVFDLVSPYQIAPTGDAYGTYGWTTTQILLSRVTSGFFDSTSFNATSYNRGFITLLYEA